MKTLIMQFFEGNVFLHSRENVLEGPMLKLMAIFLAELGYMQVDQNKFCYMSEAVRFDPKKMRIYFDDEGKLSCPVSRSNKSKVSAYFDNL